MAMATVIARPMTPKMRATRASDVIASGELGGDDTEGFGRGVTVLWLLRRSAVVGVGIGVGRGNLLANAWMLLEGLVLDPFDHEVKIDRFLGSPATIRCMALCLLGMLMFKLCELTKAIVLAKEQVIPVHICALLQY